MASHGGIASGERSDLLRRRPGFKPHRGNIHFHFHYLRKHAGAAIELVEELGNFSKKRFGPENVADTNDKRGFCGLQLGSVQSDWGSADACTGWTSRMKIFNSK